MSDGALQARGDDDKAKKENGQNKTIYKEAQPQIMKHTDIRVRKVWYELKRSNIA